MNYSMKSAFKKIRDRLLNNLAEPLARVETRITGLQQQLDTLESRMNSGREELRTLAQLRSNTEQGVQIATNIKDMVSNSGCISVSPSEIITKVFTGLKIYLDPRDISVVPHLALDASWEYDATIAWLNLIKPRQTILDIGANFGYFGALAAQKTGRDSKVILFEANPELIPYINKTLSVNWLNRQAKIENLAIADQKGRVKLNVLQDYIGSSSLHSSKQIDEYMHHTMYVKTEKTVSVLATTIDAYCKENQIDQVDLIKMDIEGYEEKAYAGMRKTIKNSTNATLFVEFTKDSYDNPRQFYEQMLTDFGHVYLIGNDGKLIKPRDTSYEQIVESSEDWVMPVFSKDGSLTAAKE